MPENRKKRKFELGRASASTKLGAKRVRVIRTMGFAPRNSSRTSLLMFHRAADDCR